MYSLITARIPCYMSDQDNIQCMQRHVGTRVLACVSASMHAGRCVQSIHTGIHPRVHTGEFTAPRKRGKTCHRALPFPLRFQPLHLYIFIHIYSQVHTYTHLFCFLSTKEQSCRLFFHQLTMSSRLEATRRIVIYFQRKNRKQKRRKNKKLRQRTVVRK